ncbi:MAG: flagellar hook-length control protein FliK [Parashewanella sp.]
MEISDKQHLTKANILTANPSLLKRAESPITQITVAKYDSILESHIIHYRQQKFQLNLSNSLFQFSSPWIKLSPESQGKPTAELLLTRPSQHIELTAQLIKQLQINLDQLIKQFSANSNKAVVLGEGNIINNNLFILGKKLSLSTKKLSNGRHIVTTTLKNNQPLLKLTPIIDYQPIEIKKLTAASDQTRSNSNNSNVSNSYRRLLNLLSVNNSEQAELPYQSAQAKRLQATITNTGATAPTPSNSSFIVSQQLIKELTPPSVTNLLTSQAVKAELVTSARLMGTITSLTSSQTKSVNMQALASLFQVLLFTKHSEVTSSLGTKKNLYFQQLQQQLNVTNQMLIKLIDKGGLTASAQLIDSFEAHHKASVFTQDNWCWHFCLPYSLNHQIHCLEGKLQRRNNSDEEEQHWQLQLKFQLADGQMLSKLTLKSNNRVTIALTVDQAQLKQKALRHMPQLQQRLHNIGYDIEQTTIKHNKVPFSLLEQGDQLIHTRA